jgi:CubicO group peptidase (beta-lactamase class C family)
MNLALKLVLFVSSFAFSVLSFAGPMQDIKSRQELEQYLTESEFSGVIGVSQNSKLIYKKAFGLRNLNSSSPILTTDKFQIGSVTKQFVAVSLLKLQQEKKLSLTDKLSKYFPNYPRAEQVQLIDVLQHVSGVNNYTDQSTFWELVSNGQTLTLDEIINYSTKFPYDFDPKTKWKYSNTGYILAGKIVEIVSGQSWDDYITEHLLKPLQLNNIGYVADFNRVSEVSGHLDSNGSLVVAPDFNLSWALSAGALYSDIDDLLNWTKIYSESDILNSQSKSQLLATNMQSYALGVLVSPYFGDTKISHSGRTPGFSTTLSYLKNSKLAVAKLDNNDGAKVNAEPVVLKFFSSGKAQALKLKLYPVTRAEFDQFVGVYKGSTMNFNVFIKNNSLFLQPDDGQPAYQLYANDKDSFRIMNIAGEEFIRNSQGKIVGLRHYQGGAVSDFTKLAAK